jgi:SAM-dependent methyltransferase
MPWWAKMGAAIALSRLPAGNRLFERLGLFEHAANDDPAYALRVVREHVARAGWMDLQDRAVLELGPGGNLATAVIAKALGARQIGLVDAGAFARTDLAPYVRLAEFLKSQGLRPPEIHRCADYREMLDACDAKYLTTGLAAMTAIRDGAVDFVFSQAALEHVRLGEFPVLVKEMRRILRPHGVASHQVDLKDHLTGSLNHLRFDERTWESPFMASSGFYTNRLRRSDIVDLFQAAGFHTQVTGIKRWPALPLPRQALAPAFRDLPDDELRISEFDIVGRPATAMTAL